MREDEMKHMAERFLSWKLPANFNPDGGISAKRPNYGPNVAWEPTGTNLFDFSQAMQMVRHMVEGLPCRSDLLDYHKPDRVSALSDYMRRKAKNASDISKMMAREKSLRQARTPPRDDLYMAAEPEETVEWEIADILAAVAQRMIESLPK
jgi:hypothetical protein